MQGVGKRAEAPEAVGTQRRVWQRHGKTAMSVAKARESSDECGEAWESGDKGSEAQESGDKSAGKHRTSDKHRSVKSAKY